MSEIDLQNVRSAYECIRLNTIIRLSNVIFCQVERFLLSVIDESYFNTVSMQYCVVMLEIFEVGSWIIKYSKKMGLIVNNRFGSHIRRCHSAPIDKLILALKGKSFCLT